MKMRSRPRCGGPLVFKVYLACLSVVLSPLAIMSLANTHT